MLKLENLSVGYHEIKVLDSVNMEFKPKEIVALIGPNGAGKSTVLKSIYGLTQLYSGRILYKNKAISGKSSYELVSVGISYLPQGKINFPHLTVNENLIIGMFHLKDKKAVKKELDRTYSRFPFLFEKRKLHAYSLSGGQQQILALARAILQNPDVLLLDEPSLGLSPKAQDEIFTIIKDLNEEGKTIIIAEQNARRAVEIAHRTYVLENGKVAFEGDEDTIENPKIKEVYLGVYS